MVESTQQPRKPFFTFAGWVSLLVPLLAAGWYCYAAPAQRLTDPADRVEKMRTQEKTYLVVLAVVFAVSFAAGCVSLWGVKANGAIVILPPAILGILISLALEVIALFFLVLTGLPGP